MADSAKEVVEKAVEGVKNLAVSKDQPKGQKEAKPKKEKKKKAGDATDGRPTELSPPPEFLDYRIKIL
jgi:threonyl-tRNA synthetase